VGLALQRRIVVQRCSYQDEMIHEQRAFEDYVGSIASDVLDLGSHTDLSRVHQVSGIVAKMKVQLAEAQEKADVFNNRELLFGRPVTSYESLQRVIKQVCVAACVRCSCCWCAAGSDAVGCCSHCPAIVMPHLLALLCCYCRRCHCCCHCCVVDDVVVAVGVAAV
jgi:hypothetical protein